MGLNNSNARAVYFNVAAGLTNFASFGATNALSRIAANGYQVGVAGRSAVNFVNIANLGVTGISLGHSVYEVISRSVRDNDRLSSLTIVQLTSSILFFGHSLYSFQFAGEIINNSQVTKLKEISDLLKSNNQRKTFNKLTKETVRLTGSIENGQAEVITAVTKNSNPSELIGTLKSLNKQFNRNGIRFSADKGGIKLNGNISYVNSLIYK